MSSINNNNSSEDMWLKHYDQLHQLQEMNPCFNSMNMTTSSSGCILEDVAVHEAAGRRSRASRRAVPTTLLNANPSNFRALVQKFTGRSAGGESLRRKGPVTLDFGSPTTISKEAIFPVSTVPSHYSHDHALNQHVSSEPSHVTWSGSDQATTTSHQLDDESNSAFDQDYDLLKEYSGNSSYDGLDHMDYYCDDFNLETATLEELLMKDLA